MLIFGSDLKGKTVLSLHTSMPIGQLAEPVINPYDLKIVAFKLTGPRLDNPNDSYLLVQDIREISPIGFIVNSSDEIVSPADVIKLKEVIELGFTLPGVKVISKTGAKLGKVASYTLDLSTMIIEQILVERPFFKALVDPELIIHRSKIIEITNEQITVKAEKEKPKARQSVKAKIEPVGEFVNPFRKDPKPEVNSSSRIK